MPFPVPDTGGVDGAEDEDARRSRFEAVAALVVEPVRRFLARRTDPDTADDVLADTLLVLWRRLDDVPAGDEALPWTYAVARNALANAERGLRRQRRLAHRITVTDPPGESIRTTSARSRPLARPRSRFSTIVSAPAVPIAA